MTSVHDPDLLAEQFGNGCAVCRVQGGVDFVKQVKGRRVAALDGKDEGQGHQGLLPPAELLHQHRFIGSKRHLVYRGLCSAWNTMDNTTCMLFNCSS